MTLRTERRPTIPMARPVGRGRRSCLPGERPAAALRAIARAGGLRVAPFVRPMLTRLLPLFVHRRLTAAVLALALVGTAAPTLAGIGRASSGGSAADALAGVPASAAEGLASPVTPSVTSSPVGPVPAIQLAPSAATGLAGVAGGPGGPDPLDLMTKGVIVLVLLYGTLRVLRRVQGGPAPAGSHLAVIESRTLASKASLHLVAVGGRRLVVGLTPSGMVALADVDAADLAVAGENASLGTPDATGTAFANADGGYAVTTRAMASLRAVFGLPRMPARGGDGRAVDTQGIGGR